MQQRAVLRVRGADRVALARRCQQRREIEHAVGQRDAGLGQNEHVLLVGERGGQADFPGAHDLGELMARASDRFEVEPTGADDPALLHFTSGTTGTPKGAVHVHGAALAHYASGRYALDLHADDIFWCTADPGWVTGTSYGIIAPLLHGVTSIVDEVDFDAERWYRLLESQSVTVWSTAPTGLRREDHIQSPRQEG